MHVTEYNLQMIPSHLACFCLQYKLASAINKSDDRRELPTVPQPTHTVCTFVLYNSLCTGIHNS